MRIIADISSIGPRGWTIVMFIGLGLFLIASIMTSSASGEMSEGRDGFAGRVVRRDEEPRRFAFMIGTCAFGALVCFGCAGFVALFM